MNMGMRSSLSIGVVLLMLAGAVSAHHSFAGVFDGTRALHLEGIVARVELTNPHSYIHLEVRTAEGTIERWALEGPSLPGLRRRGLEHAVKAGDTIDVCGYAARPPATNGGASSAAGAPRRLSAAVLTLPGGEPQLWENYRQGKCGLDS
jgi:hypothetical protein